MDPVDKAEAKNKLGNTYFVLRKYTIAIQYYSQAIEICPQIAKYYNNRAQCHIKLYDFVKGLGDAKKCVAYDRANIKGYLRLVECALCSGDIKFAEKTIQTAVGVMPENKHILNCSARVKLVQILETEYVTLVTKKNYADALKNIEKSLEQSPFCLSYMIRKAECLMLLEKFTEAIHLAEDILKFKATNEDAIYIKACSLLYAQDLNETTFKIIQELKRQQPDHLKTVRVYQNLTAILNAQNSVQTAIEHRDYQQAYKLLTQAIKMIENYTYIKKKLLLQKIYVAKQTGLLWAATKDCTEYLEQIEIDVSVLKKRAQFYMDLEEYDLAVEDYQLILLYEDVSAIQDKIQDAKVKYEKQSQEHYKILKLQAKYTKEDVKNAFKHLVIHYHPDKKGVITSARKKLLDNKIIRARNAMNHILRNIK